MELTIFPASYSKTCHMAHALNPSEVVAYCDREEARRKYSVSVGPIQPRTGVGRELRRKLMIFRTWQLRRALEPLREALESHHRSLEGLESALIEFEETLSGRKERPERPQVQQGDEEGGGFDLLSMTDVCQELGMGKSWVYRRIQSGE